MRPHDPKAKLKTSNGPVSANISTSASNRNLTDLKNSLTKSPIQTPSNLKPRLTTTGQTPTPQQSEQRIQKPAIVSIRENPKAAPQKPVNRGSVHQDLNLLPLVGPKNSFTGPESSRASNQARPSIASTSVKSPIDHAPKLAHSPLSQNNIKSTTNPVRQNFPTDKFIDSKPASLTHKQPSVKRLSSNISDTKGILKPISPSKSFIDKDSSLSQTQNSQNDPKKDSLSFAADEKIKLTQRSHDLNCTDKTSNQFKNSFMVDRGENDETSKMSIEVLQSIKVILDDLKRSVIEDGGEPSDEEEEREILVLEDKVNRLRAKLITQGFRYMCRWMERKVRGRKRELIRLVRPQTGGFGKGYLDIK